MRATTEEMTDEPASSSGGKIRPQSGNLGRAVGVASTFVGSFHPRSLPPMLRANYRREIFAWMFLPVMLGAVEGGTISIIVKKVFEGAPGLSEAEINFAVAAVTAAPALANVSSFIWASLSHGRNKVAFIGGLQLVTAGLVAALALIPVTQTGLYLLVGMVMAARMCWSGVITIRTAVWGANYPRADRARIAGKMATVQSLVLSGAGLTIGLAMDYHGDAFRLLFPLSAVVGLMGFLMYRRVRLRGRQRLMRAEKEGRKEDRPSLSPVSILRVLHQDRLYRRFMMCMFVFGLGNLMLTAPLAIVLEDQFDASYLEGIMILTAIPMGLMPLSIPLWATLLQRRHIIDFRARHAWVFVLAASFQLLAVFLQAMPIFYMAAVITGVAYGGGVLAWNLGHHDFAPPGRDSQYMGVHVTLTGVRGLLAPFLGVGLYQILNELAAGAGRWVFAICLAANLAGATGFVLLARSPRTPARERAKAR